MRRTALYIASLLALIGLVPAGANAQAAHWAVPLRADIARLNSVDWRLATRAAPRCALRSAGTGLALDSLAAYPEVERPAIAAALAMADGVVIAAIAENSPAASAGLAVGDRLLAINGAPLEAPAQADLVAESAAAALAALPAAVPAQLDVVRDGHALTVALVPVSRCAARSILVTEDKVDAYSDAANLAITTGLVAFAANEDEIALLAGHELAHIILTPEQKIAGVTGKRKEREADRLGAEIAACAGYDIALASHFWDRFDGTRAFGFLPTLTHPRSKTRQRDIAALAGSVDCAGFSSSP